MAVELEREREREKNVDGRGVYLSPHCDFPPIPYQSECTQALHAGLAVVIEPLVSSDASMTQAGSCRQSREKAASFLSWPFTTEKLAPCPSGPSPQGHYLSFAHLASCTASSPGIMQVSLHVSVGSQLR